MASPLYVWVDEESEVVYTRGKKRDPSTPEYEWSTAKYKRSTHSRSLAFSPCLILTLRMFRTFLLYIICFKINGMT
jgi:hypothetical protein